MLKENDLIKLGFLCNYETIESSGAQTDWYYYSKKIGSIDFISNASDSGNAKNDMWFVEILEGDIVFNDVSELETLIELLQKNLK